MDGRFWMHCTKKMKTGTKQDPIKTIIGLIEDAASK